VLPPSLCCADPLSLLWVHALRRLTEWCVLSAPRTPGVGPTFVVKIVQQSGEAPELFASARFTSIGADASFYGQHMFAQRFRLRVFADKVPGVSAGWQEFSLDNRLKP
jgi:hypothetical protein